MSETNAILRSDKSVWKASSIALAAWLVPGLGYLLLKRWERGAVLFLCICSLAFAGFALRGQVYLPRSSDFFSILGFLAQIGAGALYFLAHLFEPHGADVSRVAGDFGTRFLAIAGILNFLCVLDVWQISHRRKP